MSAANGSNESRHHFVATDRWARLLGLLFLVVVMLTPESGLSQSTTDGADLGPIYTNSIGMRLVRIPSGSFSVGSEAGHSDEEAVVFVTWVEATAFTQWLSEKEGLPYRLPTEWEWEYAARAGTTGPYSTGDELPSEMPKDGVMSLAVGFTGANPWGLFDMHGNVAEWTRDWYGPYPGSAQVDPVGPADGDVRVMRGGSHSRGPEFLGSANRMGALPDDRTQFIGFRVVLGDPLITAPLPVVPEDGPRRLVDRSAARCRRHRGAA